jgi:hypothetical protein
VQAVLGWTFLVIVFLVISSTAQAQDNQCDPGEYPDVIVGDLHQTVDYGSVGDISAFSVGTVSCNIGTCWLNWFASGTEHPVIAQNMFRLKDGRFTQIGQSWLKHGFTALQQDVCATPENPCQPSGTGSRLGVYCSDPYGAGLNGIQTGLGPKFEVNAATGEYIWPPTDLSQTGNAIYKRLQVHNDDLDPNLNPGAQYFVEGQYVTHDDATAGRMNNNSSYRAINVSGSSGNFSIALTDATVREQAALFAWVAAQPGVKVSAIHVPEDPPGCDFALGRCGQINVGYVATANPDGTWRYEFAVQNQTSECSVGTFHVPIEAIAYVTNVGFRDVDYHSGEPFDDTDWVWDRDASGITWHTVGDYAADPNGNAIRWGTLYNFWFDTTIRPGAGGFMQLGTFNPCTTPDVDVFARFPGTCAEGSDGDSDTYGMCDCNDSDSGAWGQPGETTDLLVGKNGSETTFQWTAPAQLGGTVAATQYELLRTQDSFDFTNADCLPDPTSDIEDPPAGSWFSYLVRARSACSIGGEGPLGTDSQGVAREGSSCP